MDDNTTCTLNDEQQNVVNAVMSGQNVFITGPAGVGKSFIISYICQRLAQMQKSYRLLAPTGVAAINISGRTIHSFLKIMPEVRTLRDYIKTSMRRSNVPWNSLDCIVIDEISMVQPKLFRLFDQIARLHRRKEDTPFGGIQMILIGDLHQLPYIADQDDSPEDVEEFGSYIFQSPTWKEMNIQTHLLSTVMRQSDADFILALADLRQGKWTPAVKHMIKFCSSNTKEEGKHYIKLFATNVLKNHNNDSELSQLKTQMEFYEAEDFGEIRALTGCRAERNLLLKVGAPVMLLWNDHELDLCNGSLGIVQSFDVCRNPIVKFNNGVTIPVVRRKWKVCHRNRRGDMEVVASRNQIPLALAYSISVHKSQGLTLDHVECDCRNIFTTGQLYVALSRARSMEGLIITNFKKRAMMVDERIVEFYDQFSRNTIELQVESRDAIESQDTDV